MLEYSLGQGLANDRDATGPQHTPHRVTNLEGMNVSLSTEHKNPRAIRRINVHLANHFLRNRLGLPSTSTNVEGVMAHVKQALARGVRVYEKVMGREKEQYVYPKTFVVDPSQQNGIRFLQSGESFVAPHQQISD